MRARTPAPRAARHRRRRRACRGRCRARCRCARCPPRPSCGRDDPHLPRRPAHNEAPYARRYLRPRGEHAQPCGRAAPCLTCVLVEVRAWADHVRKADEHRHRRAWADRRDEHVV
eukprot:1361880-Pleurochrysis_carterae.AAC.1